VTLRDLLQEVVTGLESLQIPYMISGSLAQSLYATPRMTRGIDLVLELSADRLPSFGGLFKTNFYYPEPTVKEELKRQGMFNVIDHRIGV
jgi:hypothetical protein